VEKMIYSIVNQFFNIYSIVLIIYVLSSWFPNFRDTPVGVFLAKVSEPYLSVFRRFIPPIGGMIDISPIVALFVLHFVELGVYTIIGWVL
jgi:YggT family protein